MKLSFFNRLLICLLLLFCVALSIVLILVGLNVISSQRAIGFVELFYTDIRNNIILIVCALILLFICVKLILPKKTGKREKEAALVSKTEAGGTYISMSAIDSIVNSYFSKQPFIERYKTGIKCVEGGVEIAARLSILAEMKMPELSDMLQSGLKKYVENTAGVQVKEISILVESADTSLADPEQIDLDALDHAAVEAAELSEAVDTSDELIEIDGEATTDA